MDKRDVNENIGKIINIVKETIEKNKREGRNINWAHIVDALAVLGLSAVGLTFVLTQCGYNPEHDQAVVRHVYTNLYSTLPEKNAIEDVNTGDIISYHNENSTEWIQNDDKTHTFFKVDSAIKDEISAGSEDAVSENINNSVKYDNRDIYVLSSSIDEYVECIPNNDALKFREGPSVESTDLGYAKDGTLYVCIDSEAIGDDKFKSAIRVLPSGDIERGYVSTNYIDDPISDKCLGVANSHTFLRSSAELPEFIDENVGGTAFNGQVINILDDSDEKYYECTIEGDKKTYYIAKNTVTLMKDFDYYAVYEPGIRGNGKIYGFSDDGTLITRKNQDNQDVTIADGEGLLVDVNSSKDGYYLVYDADSSTVGYIEGSRLRDTDSKSIIADIYDLRDIQIRNGRGLSQDIDEQGGNVDHNQDENENSSIIPEEGKDATQQDKPGYQIDDNKPTIMLDAKCLNPTDLKALIKKYKESGIEVSAVNFTIGSTTWNNAFGIATTKDSDKIFNKYKNDPNTTSIQKAWDEMQSKGTFNGGPSDRQDADELIECIEYCIDNDIAVGMYYYSGPENETEVSMEAAYIYGVVKYVNEYSEKYRNYDKKLPFCIDIECPVNPIDRFTSKNTRRAELTQRLIELLGDGINVDNVDNSERYFCIDGKSVKEGYGVISKEQGVLLYGDIRNNGDKLLGILNGEYWEMTDNLKTEGYYPYLWATTQLRNIGYQATIGANEFAMLTDPERELKEYTKMRYDNNGNLKPQDIQKLYDEAVMAQVQLEGVLEGIVHDVSYVTKANLHAMINGVELPEGYTYEDAMSDAINKTRSGERTSTDMDNHENR